MRRQLPVQECTEQLRLEIDWTGWRDKYLRAIAITARRQANPMPMPF
jgi:hypothetical protein